MTEVVATNATILVVGGGISGMTAALEAAETGRQVVLVEKRPYLGGRVSQLYKYFPKLCFPTCGLELNQRRARMNPNLKVLTMAEVTGIGGEQGSYTASVKLSPRYVNENCTGCGECGKAVAAEFDDEYNYGLGKRKGAYLPYRMAYPQRYVLAPAILGTEDARKAREACKYDAVAQDGFPVDIALNREGFIEARPENGGIFAAGCAADALDVNRAVQQATGAALRAIQAVSGATAVEA